MENLVIFDLDGTILNTLEDLADSCNYILQKFGMPLRTTEEVRFFVGNGIPKLIERAFPAGTSSDVLDLALKEYVEYYEKNSCVKTCAYDGILNLLKKLKSNGIFLAVNSNKVNEAAQILCNQFFPDIFDFVLGNSKDLPTKPNPEGVFRIIKNIEETALKNNPKKINLNNVFFVGDSDVDIKTGRNAGVGTVIGVDWGFRGTDFLLKHGANVVAKNPEELFEIIMKKINGGK